MLVVDRLDAIPAGEVGAVRVAGDRTIAVLPALDLAAGVALMQANEAVVGFVVAGERAARQLAAMTARIAGDDVFGLDKVVAPGTAIETRTIRDHADKLACMAEVARYVERTGLPDTRRASIEQCIDEMVMNALYDAPVDQRGEHIFAGVSAKQRIAMRTDHSVQLQFAHDAEQLAVSVRDAFGSLGRATVLTFLDKSLHSDAPVDRRAGGAGLGLYLMVNEASAVIFHLLPTIATEVVCVFALDGSRPTTSQLELVIQRDPHGQTPSPPARKLRSAQARRRLAMQIAGGVALAGAVVAGAWTVRALTEHRPTAAMVVLDSQPPGALVRVDGVAAGTTPLELASLAPETNVAIAFELRGYRTATVRVDVPGRGSTEKLAQPLELDPAFVRVHFTSEPPGAAIVPTGQRPTADRTYTPADLFLEAGKPQQFTLWMPEHAPLEIDTFTPARGANGYVVSGTLVAGSDR